MLYCNSCGFVGQEHNASEVSPSDAMDMLEAGEIEWSEYEEILEGDKFTCPNCSSRDTEVSGGL